MARSEISPTTDGKFSNLLPIPSPQGDSDPLAHPEHAAMGGLQRRGRGLKTNAILEKNPIGFASNGPESTAPQNAHLHRSQITFGSFVEHKFAKEYVALKRYSGQAFYQAMLKHIILPEEVDRIFQRNLRDPRKKLKAIPDWPYLSTLRLSEVRPDDVTRLTSAALLNGYSVNTVKHIRHTICAIFTHAIQEKFLSGENPVNFAKAPRSRRAYTPALTPAQATKALSIMQYPEKEMTLLGILTGMSPAEVTGLQWRHINLTNEELHENGMRISPRTIAVRQRWYRGEMENVKENRVRDLALHDRLIEILIELKRSSRFAAPDDTVLVTRVGTPISQDNVMARRLRPIARQLGLRSLSWQSFRRNYEVFGSRLAERCETS